MPVMSRRSSSARSGNGSSAKPRLIRRLAPSDPTHSGNNGWPSTETAASCSTDGLVERRGESLSQGLERLRQASGSIRAALNGAEAIDVMIGSLLEELEPTDDVAVLLLELEGASSGIDLRVAATANELVRVRRTLRRWLSDLAVPPRCCDDVITAVGEAAANVVEHAYGLMGGTMHVLASYEEGMVRVKVSDDGRWRSRPSARGRGRLLMETMMDSVEYDTSGGGTTVMMRLSVP